MIRRLHRNDRGATAIEYAVIAGLIGLGIVGSLVTTRGSLNFAFGRASSQLGNTGGTPASTGPTSTSPRASFWSAKTLDGAPVASTNGSVKATAYKYTDGATARFSTGNSGNYPNQLAVYDPATNAMSYYFTDTGGNPVLYQVNYLNQYGQVVQAVYADQSVGDTFSGATPNTQRTVNFEYGGSTAPNATVTGTTSSRTTPSAAFTDGATRSSQDYQYFNDIK